MRRVIGGINTFNILQPPGGWRSVLNEHEFKEVLNNVLSCGERS